MEGEMFETSETLAEFLASTSLLSESWRFCSLANTLVPPCNFIVDQIGDVGYVAFSGIQSVIGVNSCGDNNLVPLETDSIGRNSPFPLSYSREDGEEPAMVHSGFLSIFLNIFQSPIFQSQMLAVMNRSKALIVTGHSIGGTTASLAALWLLSNLQSISSPLSVLCITFGSPMLGNESLLKAILRERWGGKFCHVVSKDDLVPRLLFAPVPSVTPRLNYLLQLWQWSMIFPLLGQLAIQLSEEDKIEFHHYILSHVAAAAAEGEGSMKYPYRPFGSYLLCSENGAVCVDNATAVVEMLHLMFTTSSANSIIDDHLKYGDVVEKISQQFLQSRNFTEGVLRGSSYEMGISLALEASGIVGQDSVAEHAMACLKMAKQRGRMPYLNAANLANSLAKVNPYRAEIEWYKSLCDASDNQMGYYDSFKLRGASKRDFKVNMNRLKLAGFWDNVIHKLETNQLPHDFHKRWKWVMASLSYRLLVEPLDIAEYYREEMHRKKGHYLMYGRDRRYVIFDRWWRDTKFGEDNNNRSKYAGLTQDSCFWARVEEAKDCLETAKNENDTSKLAQLWENMNEFELYASRLINRKEVSKDVVARNSSYSVWVEEWKQFKHQFSQISHQFPCNL